ncbi:MULTISPECIES: M3 family metallopeptidase [Prochlorococcus]|uniref:oligopeptidase A n=1 Tax=Prochlorococcus marinus (strain SARG / CCMP1375 / SS120) TaxID=167539 RepID=Q7VBM4_PROMA|nr:MULTISPECIES: M3 family metallopeptidase [Prochlorococcus]AAQ00113.1 Zn-dependent oligopeptidase [Prochlorococcus marinus subsp. marinus str. CCMP1375]KGG13909.1 Oligopeptidase A [Prochlorococcus marinus str. LG]KGG19042.1 Oligopeptidase A [Prochlorococcus marinus str. SS2]KGG23418.1 Oligopeptidase A [Prochlorococcus marinus str. SS35]KGG32346.1 Oligopeptidase A [Prochlorococcus marinus str. SS51]
MQKLPALLIGKGLPLFEEITSLEIEQCIPTLLNILHKEFDVLENELKEKLISEKALTWEDLINPLYKIEEKLRWSWGIVSHLNGVSNSPELRKVYADQQPEVIRFGNRLGQSKVLFNALLNLFNKNKQSLDNTQLRILESELLSMKNRGVGLTGEDKKIFNSNSERLAELSNIFSNNVLDATKEWKLLLTKPEQIEGLPKRSLEAMAKAAKEADDIFQENRGEGPSAEKGPWLLGLDMPSYTTFITYSKNRHLREIIYKAYISRASSGKLNNQKLIEQILSIRKHQAQLLGYKNWAEISLSSKMASNVSQVEELLEELRSAAMPAAKEEIKRLELFAADETGTDFYKLAPWDVNYWSEKLRQKLFDLNQENLRAWFPLPQVLNGLFRLCERLFEISIKPCSAKYPVWHKDVELYDVLDKDDTHIASFYLDPFSRPASKRGGAWMDECLTKERLDNGDVVIPVAYLVCNQTPPTERLPSLMSFEEVKTLFHEFGHGLQHMLTKVEYPKAAGINNVEWDAVELPSQFMENWCLEEKTINDIAKHWETKQPLPNEEFQKLRLNQTFNSGLNTLRQIHFALTDIRLHNLWNDNLGITPDELRRNLAKTTCVIEPIPEDQFLCAFSHIFAGGYSAGYYSYKWAEVLSADAFSAFEEAGLDNESNIRLIGKRFRDTILSLGGSKSPNEIFQSFRGRPATSEALIKHCGLRTAIK